MKQLVIVYITTSILSLFVLGIGGWAYTQSIYTDKIREAFLKSNETSIKELKNITNLSEIVLVKGKVYSETPFLSKDNHKVVLEKFKKEYKEKDSNKWIENKDSKYFKTTSFYIKDEFENKAYIDITGVDTTFLGSSYENTSFEDNKEIKEISWNFKLDDEIYALGSVQNKAGQITIINPNFLQSAFTPFWQKEPFIVTNFSKSELIQKSVNISRNIFYSSIALFVIGIFFLITGIGNTLKNVKGNK